MPVGSFVDKIYEALRQKRGMDAGQAARIAQTKSGESLKTGKPPKRKSKPKAKAKPRGGYSGAY